MSLSIAPVSGVSGSVSLGQLSEPALPEGAQSTGEAGAAGVGGATTATGPKMYSIAPAETTAANPNPGLKSGASTAPGGELGKEQFLQLLIAEMKNQDPINPMKAEDSVAQLAQFSALEQMQNVSHQVEGYRRENNLMQSLLLKGQNMTLTMSDGTQVSGIVDKASWDGTKGMVLQINGITYPLSNISSMELTAALGGGAAQPAEAVAENEAAGGAAAETPSSSPVGQIVDAAAQVAMGMM